MLRAATSPAPADARRLVPLEPYLAMPEPALVRSMFGRIARRYDAANLILSGGADRWWRYRLVRAVGRLAPRRVLDLATGSGDVALALSRTLDSRVEVVGLDFCQPMLAQAEAKKSAAGPLRHANVTFHHGDILNLPFPDASFDAVTIAFGLRNLEDRPRGLCEMRRVLRPGGRLFILEFSQPFAWFRPIYYFYLRRLLPGIAGLVTGDRAAYFYLNETIGEFPDRNTISREIASAGFSEVSACPLTLGIVALHAAANPVVAPNRD